MVKIAITGHRPDAFLVSHYTPEMVKHIADGIVCSMAREYGKDLCFNLGGAMGVDLWVGEACIEHNVKFHLYLPFHPTIQARYWSDDLKAELDRQMQKAVGIDIVDPDPKSTYHVARYQERNKCMVDSAQFVIAFWVGKRRGGTFNAMKYALSQSKVVLNAIDELRPQFKEDLKRGWTPPTVKVPNV